MHALTRFVFCAGPISFCLGAGLLEAQPAPAAPGPNPQSASPGNPPAGRKLIFDAETKEYDASPGEPVAPFVFNVTNVWTKEIVITNVSASCGCTTANMPSVPWHLPPGGSGAVHAQVNLSGKGGLLTKTLTFFTSVGARIVYLKVSIPIAPAWDGNLTPADRKAAMSKAAADARAIFQGDCAKCHVEKGRTAFGEDLYAADCAICHESSHRESAVPDLHALKQPTDLDYWKTIITYGKPHTMMPGFAAAQGGPLSDAQITSLAIYLNRTISHHFTSATTKPASAPGAEIPVIQ
jgi:mono/diheme cytochrome c family protein